MSARRAYDIHWATAAESDLDAIVLAVLDGRRNVEDLLLDRLVRG